MLPWAELTISPDPSGVQAKPCSKLAASEHSLRLPAGGVLNQQAHRKVGAARFP